MVLKAAAKLHHVANMVGDVANMTGDVANMAGDVRLDCIESKLRNVLDRPWHIWVAQKCFINIPRF